jgi:predicted outer membrane repeat protein
MFCLINLFYNFLGQFHFSDDSNVTIKYCNFKNNSALVSGGSIYSDNNNNLILITSNMSDNRAYDGGAIYAKTNTNFYCSGTNQFVYNKAYRVGGAISCIDSYLWNTNTAATTITMKISFNQALRGSAFYFLRLKDESTLFLKSNLTISYNTAIVGGTIYWIYDNVMKAPDIEYLDIHNNFAPYGSKIATQAKYIDGPSYYNIKSYKYNASGIDLDQLLFKAFDYYNHSLVNADNDKYFFSASFNVHSQYNCLGRTPGVSR